MDKSPPGYSGPEKFHDAGKKRHGISHDNQFSKTAEKIQFYL